jgi:hypothetical protein
MGESISESSVLYKLIGPLGMSRIDGPGWKNEVKFFVNDNYRYKVSRKQVVKEKTCSKL